MHVCEVLSIFVFSGNFPETAWWEFKAIRRLMLFCDVCGFQRWDRLAALPYPPGDAWRLTNFLGICLNCLAVMINR